VTAIEPIACAKDVERPGGRRRVSADVIAFPGAAKPIQCAADDPWPWLEQLAQLVGEYVLAGGSVAPRTPIDKIIDWARAGKPRLTSRHRK
jgi:hypothetical protein